MNKQPQTPEGDKEEGDRTEYNKQLTKNFGRIQDYNYKGPKCVKGCKNFTGYETKHHPTCPFYPNSLSEQMDKLLASGEEKSQDEDQDYLWKQAHTIIMDNYHAANYPYQAILKLEKLFTIKRKPLRQLSDKENELLDNALKKSQSNLPTKL